MFHKAWKSEIPFVFLYAQNKSSTLDLFYGFRLASPGVKKPIQLNITYKKSELENVINYFDDLFLIQLVFVKYLRAHSYFFDLQASIPKFASFCQPTICAAASVHCCHSFIK